MLTTWALSRAALSRIFNLVLEGGAVVAGGLNLRSPGEYIERSLSIRSIPPGASILVDFRGRVEDAGDAPERRKS